MDVSMIITLIFGIYLALLALLNMKKAPSTEVAASRKSIKKLISIYNLSKIGGKVND